MIFSKNNDIPFLICEHFKGRDLINIKYEKLWTDSPLPTQNPENAFRVISGDFVTTDDGTGIVHTAPTFGADDMIAAQNAKPEVPPMLILNKDGDLSPLVDLQGKFIDGLGSISGKYVKNQYYNEKDVPEKSVDVEIAIKLKEENKTIDNQEAWLDFMNPIVDSLQEHYHEKIQITPHNASITNEDAAVPQIIENYKRVVSGDNLLNQVNIDNEY